LLEVYRLDLTQEWRMRRWRRLLNLLQRLVRTRTSWLNDAMADDDELAEYMIKNEKRDDSRKPTRSMREFDPVVELLSVVADRQAELAQIMAAHKGAKPRRVDPMPRPKTAYMRARNRKTRQHHTFTVNRVFGYIDAKGNPTGKEPPKK
jgi:hypothetical protein